MWFQNRRMKWRHKKESSSNIKQNNVAKNDSGKTMMKSESGDNQNTDSDCGSDIDVQTIES